MKNVEMSHMELVARKATLIDAQPEFLGPTGADAMAFLLASSMMVGAELSKVPRQDVKEEVFRHVTGILGATLGIDPIHQASLLIREEGSYAAQS